MLQKNDFQENRRTLVFIHGLSGSLSAWLEYEKKFSSDYNVLTYDLRGHGKSMRPTTYDQYTIKLFVHDLTNLLHELKIEKCTLISHSFGTLIALGFLLAHPEVVEATVFLSPALENGESKLAYIEYPIIWLLRRIMNLLPMIRHTGIHVNYSKYYGCGDWNIRRISADVPNTGFHSYFNCLDHIYRYRCGDISKIAIPTMIIHGTHDTYSSYKKSVVASKKIRNCKLVLLQGANHIVVLNNFEEVAEEIEGFVRRV